MNPKKLAPAVCASLLLILGIQFLNPTAASAGCRDYPESVTPACEAQNMAEQQARQIAEQATRQAREDQAAIDNANRAAADRAATQAADSALAPDDCSR